MERKTGEIFEYNGEWFQCLKGISCKECDFSSDSITCDIHGAITCTRKGRSDDTSVVFKKLEKVGEPYELYGHLIQKYRYFHSPAIQVNGNCISKTINIDNIIKIKIKQNKEDMEENKTTLPKEDNVLTRTVYAYVNGKISDKELIKSIKEMSDEYPYNKNNLKPFSLELAKSGKPVCTRDGRNVRIIAFDAKRKDEKNIIALVPSKDYSGFEDLIAYPNNGNYYGGHENDGDLMMLPEKKEKWVNVYKESIYNTKEEAIKVIYDGMTYIDTIKFSWEE